jgi:hypothetical protein
MIAGDASGDILVQYNLAEYLGDEESAAPVSVAAGIQNIDSLSIMRGAGVAPVFAPPGFSSTGWSETSRDDAIAQNDYYTFTISPTSGNALTLTSIDFGAFTNGSSSNRPNDFLVRSNVSGSTDLLSWSTDVNTLQNMSVPLSSFGTTFQNLTTAVEFRLFGWNGRTGAWALANNSDELALVIKGTVSAVPEPAAVWLGGLVCGPIVAASSWRSWLARGNS